MHRDIPRDDAEHYNEEEMQKILDLLGSSK